MVWREVDVRWRVLASPGIVPGEGVLFRSDRWRSLENKGRAGEAAFFCARLGLVGFGVVMTVPFFRGM
jgi:hypothetical protein